MSRKNKRRKYSKSYRFNWDAADGLRINQINRNTTVSSKCWEVDQLSDPNVRYFDEFSSIHGECRGPIKKIKLVGRFKCTRINGYKGKINGEE